MPLIIKHIQLTQKKLKIKTQTQQIHYQTFTHTLLPNKILITTQHLNNQYKTFLLTLKHNNNPTKLSTIKKISKFTKTQLIHPLLTHTQKKLKQ